MHISLARLGNSLVCAFLGVFVMHLARADVVPSQDCSKPIDLTAVGPGNRSDLWNSNIDGLGAPVSFSRTLGHCYITIPGFEGTAAIEIAPLNFPDQSLSVSLKEPGGHFLNLSMDRRYGFTNTFVVSTKNKPETFDISIKKNKSNQKKVYLLVETLIYHKKDEVNLFPGIASVIVSRYYGPNSSITAPPSDVARISVSHPSYVKLDFTVVDGQTRCDATPGISLFNESGLPIPIRGNSSDLTENEAGSDFDSLKPNNETVPIVKKLGSVQYSGDDIPSEISVFLYPGAYFFSLNPSCNQSYRVVESEVPVVLDQMMESLESMILSRHMGHKLQPISVILSPSSQSSILRQFQREEMSNDDNGRSTTVTPSAMIVFRSSVSCDEDLEDLGALLRAARIVSDMTGIPLNQVAVGVDAGRGSIYGLMNPFDNYLDLRMPGACAGEAVALVPSELTKSFNQDDAVAKVSTHVTPSLFDESVTKFLAQNYPGAKLYPLDTDGVLIPPTYISLKMKCLHGVITGKDALWELVYLTISLNGDYLSVSTTGLYTAGIENCPMREGQYTYSLEGEEYGQKSKVFAQDTASRFVNFLKMSTNPNRALESGAYGQRAPN